MRLLVHIPVLSFLAFFAFGGNSLHAAFISTKDLLPPPTVSDYSPKTNLTAKTCNFQTWLEDAASGDKQSQSPKSAVAGNGISRRPGSTKPNQIPVFSVAFGSEQRTPTNIFTENNSPVPLVHDHAYQPGGGSMTGSGSGGAAGSSIPPMGLSCKVEVPRSEKVERLVGEKDEKFPAPLGFGLFRPPRVERETPAD